MKKSTPLKDKFDALPRSVTREQVLSEVKKEGISEATYYRDLKTDGNQIPTWRMRVYAGLLNCDLEELLNSYVKPKPIVKTNLAKRAGIKSIK
jgi:hypothetical protein